MVYKIKVNITTSQGTLVDQVEVTSEDLDNTMSMMACWTEILHELKRALIVEQSEFKQLLERR